MVQRIMVNYCLINDYKFTYFGYPASSSVATTRRQDPQAVQFAYLSQEEKMCNLILTAASPESFHL